ncbi:MAG TPA: CoA activase [Lachnospiraceae bacterium]|jgi:predicted CoA-substrate-specific enzyme activase|uniref:acyl-CoA dehydratase activase n=1 Tax=Clostridium sp. (strain SY8519) TaxID=1042156 RepID=UPI0002171A9B|nr:acyl-CoA dehydratase activase [Clostridium sp. SY8519]BAK46378.1 activator of 2-hydroxyglutaryl-CoA dehydratase [Clostridium sp. SY8519]HAD20216.1 CoA activase [Lachnospiraceae bacterium]
MYYIGIDIGSSGAKTVVFDTSGNLIYRQLQPTGWSSADTAEAIRKDLVRKGYDPSENPCVATGYGRISVPYADKQITEITCHGRGASWLFQTDRLVIVDIGGQDTKVICMEEGMVRDFIMNDKCSAGTGRFLEVMANSMAIRPEELCAIAAEGSGTEISSLCTVFAESEVISLIGRGEKRANIAYGVVHSIVNKVAAQCSRADLEGRMVCLTGGLCTCDYLRRSLGEALHTEISACPDGRYAGAIGAALSAGYL